MGLFDKIKQGVNKSVGKAKVTVEVNRFKGQISEKQNEIEDIYNKIGKYIFESIKDKKLESIDADLQEFFQQIIKIQEDIHNIELKIKESHNEKECPCGKIVLKDVRFCPFCGHEFENEPENELG